MQVDTGLIVEGLRRRGHSVGNVIPVPDNAGEYEFEIDGHLLTLAEARALMEADDASVDSESDDVVTEVLVVEAVPVVVVEE